MVFNQDFTAKANRYLIIGAGAVGLAMAKRLLDLGHQDVCILEKESRVGVHASGNNSGVLHAGVYYPSDTLKAKFCLEGNRRLKAYCHERGLPILACGKALVATQEADLATLDTLYARGTANGAKLEWLNQAELNKREPSARTFGDRALWVHDTAIVDPLSVVQSYAQDIERQGGRILLNTKFLGRKDQTTILTSQGDMKFKILINCAGGYADQVAHAFGVGLDYRLIPFKGIYRKLVAPEGRCPVNGNIYPVPNIENPFLGVHFTRKINGDIYVGPTAIPALGPENYGILSGVGKEALGIISADVKLFFHNSKFRRVALTEPRKYLRHFLFQDAKKLVHQLEPSWLKPSHKVGIRPQLVDMKRHTLMMDFLVEKAANSVHILNAISPAFTCSLAFAESVVSEYLTD